MGCALSCALSLLLEHGVFIGHEPLGDEGCIVICQRASAHWPVKARHGPVAVLCKHCMEPGANVATSANNGHAKATPGAHRTRRELDMHR